MLNQTVMGTDWTWDPAKSYTIEEIGMAAKPEWKPGWTGGTANDKGILTFQYDPAKALTLHAVNEEQRWNIKLMKRDSEDPDAKLNGAVFALYSPNAADAMQDADYENLAEKPEKTLRYQDQTWYLMDLKTTAEGQITWENLTRKSYCVVEVKAPAGYRLEDKVIPVTRNGKTAELIVNNTAGRELPRSGGMGRMPLTLAGLAMMTASAACLLAEHLRRRRSG